MTIIWSMVTEIWWATERIFYHFGPLFCPFTPQQLEKIIEKMKQTRGHIILQKCNQNHDHMPYCSWDMAHDRCNFHFSFWAIFCPFTSITWKTKIFEMKKTPGDIILLHMCTKNYDYMMYSSWDMVCNGRTDRQKEKVAYRGGCPT